MADDNALDIILRLQDELSPALAKAQASIRDAAGNLAGMTNAVKESNAAHLELIDTLKEVAGAFGIAFTLDAAIEFLHTIVENAQQLQNLSVQTRINVEDLQLLTAATKDFGVQGDQVGRALFTLSQRIAGNDSSVATAYALMGISIDDIKNKDALDLFLTTERGLGTLQGTLRDTAAADLYGGKLGASMAAFSTGVDEAMAKARELNTVASTESVKALAEYGNAVERAKDNLLAMATTMVGPVAQGFNVLNDATDKGASKWAIAAAMAKDWYATHVTGTPHVENLTHLLDGLSQSTDKVTGSTKAGVDAQKSMKVALDAHGQASQFMATLEINASKPLLDWQLQYLQQLDARGQLDAKTAAGIGVNVQQLQAYQANLKATADAMRIMADVEAEADAEAMTGYAARIKSLSDLSKAHLQAYSFGAQIAALEQLDAAEQVLAVNVEHELTSEQDRAKVRADASKQHIDLMNQESAVQQKQAQVVNAALLDEFNAQVKLNAEWGLNAVGAVSAQVTALDRLNQALADLHAKKVEGISQSAQEQVLMDAYTKSIYDEAVAQDAATAAYLANTQAVKDNVTAKQSAASFSLAGGSSVPDKFKGLSSSDLQAMGLIDMWDRVTLAGAAAGLGTGPQGVTAASFGGGRDSGGPVAPGRSYLIGTGAQPEMFIPSVPGTMVPNGSGMSITIAPGAINVTAGSLNDPNALRDLATQISSEIVRQAGQLRQFAQ